MARRKEMSNQRVVLIVVLGVVGFTLGSMILGAAWAYFIYPLIIRFVWKDVCAIGFDC
jgi:hypothetical protein